MGIKRKRHDMTNKEYYNEIWLNENDDGKYGAYWGGLCDIATDVEDIYEDATNRSCVYWVGDPDGFEVKPPSDTLDDRPNEFSTSGYTSEFEYWGQVLVVDAVDNGCTTTEEVIEYVREHANDVDMD